jgi:hypothetical protein
MARDAATGHDDFLRQAVVLRNFRAAANPGTESYPKNVLFLEIYLNFLRRFRALKEKYEIRHIWPEPVICHGRALTECDVMRRLFCSGMLTVGIRATVGCRGKTQAARHCRCRATIRGPVQPSATRRPGRSQPLVGSIGLYSGGVTRPLPPGCRHGRWPARRAPHARAFAMGPRPPECLPQCRNQERRSAGELPVQGALRAPGSCLEHAFN